VSTSTTETTAPIPPRHDVDVTSTTRRTDMPGGVLIEKDTSGTEVASPGAPGVSRTQTQTTTVR
jgi:hypothetical protein